MSKTTLILAVLFAGCEILTPNEDLVVRGTVYLDGAPAAGLTVELYKRDVIWVSDSSIQGGAYQSTEQFLGGAPTDADGKYRVEGIIGDPRCGHTAIVRVQGYDDLDQGVSECGPHRGIDFHLGTVP
jgi:hypothetical protein